MKAIGGIISLLLISPADAAPFMLHDQDQAAIQQICDLAALSPSLNRDTRAQVAAWCVSWATRVQDANRPEPPKQEPPPPGK